MGGSSAVIASIVRKLARALTHSLIQFSEHFRSGNNNFFLILSSD
jgi:hypothetical protein